MPQNLTGNDLIGNGVVITEEIGTVLGNPTRNHIDIVNNSNFTTYVTVEQIDKTTTPLFRTGSNLSVCNFTTTNSEGLTAQSDVANLTGTADNSDFWWKRGKVEYHFIATSDSPLPQDYTVYGSNDNEYRKHYFYCEYSATAGTLARNLADKINEIDIDGLQEINAGFTSFGFFYMGTSIKTAKYNNMVIYRNNTVLTTMNPNGRYPYPNVGYDFVNGHVSSNPRRNIPFIGDEFSVSFFVPPLVGGGSTIYHYQQFSFLFAANSSPIPANTFRIFQSGTTDGNLLVDIYGP